MEFDASNGYLEIENGGGYGGEFFLLIHDEGDVVAQSDFTSALTLAEIATPLPAALPLFASGLGAIGFIVRRRKRKNAAAIAA